MTWLSPGAADHAGPEQPEPHAVHMPDHLPSPVHHFAGHGIMQDLRQHIAEAVQVGDFEAVQRHIAHAEAQYLVPPHWGELLNLLWAPGPNTHQHRLGMSSAINSAFELAKTFYNILQMQYRAKTMPPGEERDQMVGAGPSFIEAMARNIAVMPPGPRRTRCEATIEALRSALAAAAAA